MGISIFVGISIVVALGMSYILRWLSIRVAASPSVNAALFVSAVLASSAVSVGISDYAECVDYLDPYWVILLVVKLAFFFPTSLVCGLAVFLLFKKRRFPIGHCQKCGYDLRTLTHGRCPECGLHFDASSEK